MNRSILGSTPEPAAVDLHVNTFNVALDGTAVQWYDETYFRADSTQDAGLEFTVLHEVIRAEEVILMIDGHPQSSYAFTAPNIFTLPEALPEGLKLRVHYLGKVTP